jgi:hypothetical protein
MEVSVRAWFDTLKRDSHAETVRLDRYATEYLKMFVSLSSNTMCATSGRQS